MPNEKSFETLKYLSELHRSLHARRQQYEWKIIFTVLSFYVLSVAAALNRNTTVPDFDWFTLAIWIVFLLLAAISSALLWFIHNANAKNKTFAEEAERAIIKVLNNEEVKLNFPNSTVRMTKWAFAWQSVTLFIVATASAIFITAH